MVIIQQPDAVSLSANLKTFIISSSAAVLFTLTQGGETILSQRYEPNQDSQIEIDLRDVIESRLYFELRDIGTVYVQPGIVSNFTATIGNVEHTFRVLRGGVDHLAGSAESYLRGNFLTWQPTVKRVTYYTPEFLTYYATGDCSAKLRAYFTDDAGNVTSQADYEIASLSTGAATTLPLQYGNVVGWLDGRLPAWYDVWIEDGTGVRLTYIQRYVCDIQLSLDEDWFLFENSLGGIDTFRAYGDMELKAEHTHNVAMVEEDNVEYRIDTDRIFHKNTGQLSKAEARWLLDYPPANRKYIYLGNSLRRIVVTSSDLSGKLRTEPTSYSFSFKLADARPLLNVQREDVPAQMLNIVVPDLGNFTLPPRLAEFPDQPLSEGVLFPVQSPYSEKWGTTTVSALLDKISGPLIDLIQQVSDGLYDDLNTGIEGIRRELLDRSELDKSYIKVDYFNRLFKSYNGETLVNANDLTSPIDGIESLYDFWSIRGITALGKGSGGSSGDGGGASREDVFSWLSGTPADSSEWINANFLKLGTGLSVDSRGALIAKATGISSIGLTVPAGFSVTGSPLTSNGTLAISLTEGYTIPTEARLETIETAITNLNEKVTAFEDLFGIDESGNVYVKNNRGFYSNSFVSALGSSSGGSSGGGLDRQRLFEILSGTQDVGEFIHGRFLKLGSGFNVANDGTITFNAVTALGTDEKSLTWTKNGTVNALTIPYATKAAQDANGNVIASTYLNKTTPQAPHVVLIGAASGTDSIAPTFRMLQVSDIPDLSSIYVTKSFFESLFELYNDSAKIATNGAIPADTSKLNIKAMFGFWTEKYISALGKNDDEGSGGGGSTTLAGLSDVNVDSATNGQVLTYKNGTWVNGTASSLDVNAMWNQLASDNSERQIHASHLSSALANYYSATISRTANTVLAAPNGSNGVATFRKLVADDIPNLAASKITSGTFDAARIPSLAASKITSGTFDAARIPDLSSKYVTIDTAQTITEAKTFSKKLTVNSYVQGYGLLVKHTVDTLQMRGIEWYDSSNVVIANILLKNTSKQLVLNATGASAVSDSVGSYNLVVGENVLTYNTYPLLTSNNYGSYLDGSYVTLLTQQTITGAKTFSANITANADIVNSYYQLKSSATNPFLKLSHTYNDSVTNFFVQAYQGELWVGANLNPVKVLADGSLKIGSCTISWDSTNGMLKFDTGVYSTGAVSALGANSDSGGGGSMDLDAMWEALGQNSNEQINKAHLTTALSGYATTTAMTNALANYVTLSTTQIITGSKTFRNADIFIQPTDDTSRITGITWINNASNSAIARLYYHNVNQNLILNPIGASNVWTDEVGKYSLFVGNNKLTYNTYPILTSNNFTNYIKYWDTTTSRTANTVLAAPNGSNGTASFRKLVAADIPTLEISNIYGLESSLNGKLSVNGTAANANRLTITSKTAWGQTYWTSDGIPTNISGNLSNVGKITATYYTIYDSETNATLEFRHTYNSTAYTYYLQVSKGSVYLGAGASKSLSVDASGNVAAVGTLTSGGSIYLGSGGSLVSSDGYALVQYKPENSSSTSTSQWGVGATNTQGVIRSNSTSLVHYRGGTNYNILDAYNYDAYALPLSGGHMTGHIYMDGVTTSTISNTTQIIFRRGSTEAVAISAINNQLIINPSSSSTTGQIGLGVNGAYSYFYGDDARVGIGTLSPSYALHVVGTVYATGDVTALSDIRYKNVVKDIDVSIEEIAKLPVFDFTWKDKKDELLHSGSSAQDIQKLFPNNVIGKDELSVNYGATGTIIGILVARGLIRLGNETKDEISALKEEIVILKQRIKILEEAA